MRTAPAIIFTGAVLLLSAACRRGPETGVVFGEREIRIGEKTVTVEVAITPAQLEQGLKYRRSLPGDRGMLFAYSRAEIRPFWMKDTLIPLSIAFIDGEGRIINIEEMEPDDGNANHWPDRPFLYALEMNRGWFEKNNIRPGDLVDTGRGEGR